MKFKDKYVFITGATSGIGKAAAIQFAAQGAHLAILGRSPQKLSEVKAEIESMGLSCISLQADVADDSQMKKACLELGTVWKRIDVLFANAGINGVWSPIEAITVEEWDQTHGINARGTFLTLKYSIPFMKKHGGSIIIDASINGTRTFSNRGTSCYASSKAAQVAFGKVAALELAQFKIRVNMICPGATVTEIDHNTMIRGNDQTRKWVDHPHGIVPLTGKEWATAEQVADSVLFFAGDQSSHITGAVLHIDGGSSLIM